jgi:glycosyltransferase involved in cell wall biosynthesis
VLSQTGPFQLEYLVVDGNSQDGTQEILRDYGDRFRWISEPDQGQVDAINKGLAMATGEIVGWLNSDDVLLPQALARVSEAFLSHPQAEWVHGRCLIVDEQDREIRRWISSYKHRLATRHSLDRLLIENYVSQPAAFWRRSVLALVGSLDPSIPNAFDYDLWIRLARRGPPIYLEEPLACFRWYEASLSGRGFEVQLQENLAVAVRYAERRRSILFRKKLAIAFTLNAYRLMAQVRRARRRPGGWAPSSDRGWRRRRL